MEKMLGKRELNKARKRAEIVTVATRSFFDKGYAATTMSSISEELGGSKATLWAHFSSKEDLFAAVVDQLVDNFAKDIDEVLTNKVFSFAAFRRASLRFLDCLLDDASIHLYRLVLSEGPRFPELNEMFYSRGPAKVRREMVTFLCTRFSEDDALRLVQITLPVITGYRADILMRPVKPTRAEREAFVDDLVNTLAWPDCADGTRPA